MGRGRDLFISFEGLCRVCSLPHCYQEKAMGPMGVLGTLDCCGSWELAFNGQRA